MGSCEGLSDHFICLVDEAFVTIECQGTHTIVVDFFDESLDPHLENQEELSIEIIFHKKLTLDDFDLSMFPMLDGESPEDYVNRMRSEMAKAGGSFGGSGDGSGFDTGIRGQ